MSVSPLPPHSSVPESSGAGLVEVVSAVQHVRKMRGGSNAHLMRASDGHMYVTKYQNNSQHHRLLANELLAGLLGFHLRLPMATMRIVDVSAWLIENTPELRIDTEGHSWVCSSGWQFGSRYAGDPEDTTVLDGVDEGAKDQLRDTRAFARALVFDKWTGNTDGRQAVFTRKARQRKWNVVFIDNGHCFDKERWQFPDLTFHGVRYRNCFYECVTGWDDFEPALSLATEMKIDDLWRYARAVPGDWYQNDRDGLCRLIETLDQRRSRIPDLITAFRQSSRQPFPNWMKDRSGCNAVVPDSV